MTGKTHRLGGMVCCLAGYSILQQKGMLLTEVNPLLQLTVMYPFALYGSVMSDLDHHKGSIPCHDIFSVGVNKVLHLTTKYRKTCEEHKVKPIPISGILDAKHRSWQTHSDIFLAIMLFLAYYLLGISNSIDGLFIKLISVGLVMGLVSHLILDMFSPEGIWSLVVMIINKIFKTHFKEKIDFVPDAGFFSTGGPWEGLIQKLLWLICIVLALRFVYTLLPYKIVFNF